MVALSQTGIQSSILFSRWCAHIVVKSNILYTPNVPKPWLLILKWRALRLAFKIGEMREVRGKEVCTIRWRAYKPNPSVYLHWYGKKAELGKDRNGWTLATGAQASNFHLEFVILCERCFVLLHYAVPWLERSQLFCSADGRQHVTLWLCLFVL